MSSRGTGILLGRLRGPVFTSICAVQAVLLVAAAAPIGALAQYPGQVTKSGKDAPELRAVAVLEWTGDPQHPKASRLVPVSVFDGQALQDGGIYLARPEPLALEGEVEYQLKEDGKNTGLFVVQNAAREQGSWVGYGTWKPLPKPKAPAQLAANQGWKEDNAQSDRPVLHRKAHPGETTGGSGSSGGGSDSGSASQAPSDPDRPTLHRSQTSGGDSSSTTSNSVDSNSPSAPSDPDRPTLHRSTSDSASTSASSTDPNQPKLKKKKDQDEAYVSSMDDNTDPDRPKLKRGVYSGSGQAVLPSLMGLPPDMQQSVAVSDTKEVPEHPWNYSWANPEDEAKMKASLEDMARTALGLNPPPPKPAPAKKTAATRTTTHKAKPAAPPAPLLDEQFRVFELAYGSGATMVLSAHTDGTGANEKFVTLVVQPDLYGSLAVLVKSVTDAAHLDDTPRMRLVDAVDAMADNRGELLFELRGDSQRQFALYRVLRGQATRIFVSGGNDISGIAENN